MIAPRSAASAPPTSMPTHGVSPSSIDSIVAVYPPTPTNAAWPAESWPA